jgi:hypothetical protein
MVSWRTMHMSGNWTDNDGQLDPERKVSSVSLGHLEMDGSIVAIREVPGDTAMAPLW